MWMLTRRNKSLPASTTQGCSTVDQPPQRRNNKTKDEYEGTSSLCPPPCTAGTTNMKQSYHQRWKHVYWLIAICCCLAMLRSFWTQVMLDGKVSTTTAKLAHEPNKTTIPSNTMKTGNPEQPHNGPRQHPQQTLQDVEKRTAALALGWTNEYNNTASQTDKQSAVQIAFNTGFWQRMQPVPYNRWNVVDNLTCVRQVSSNASTSLSTSSKQIHMQLESWQTRVPYVILIGTQKGGSTALAYYLYNHPEIVYLPTKELHYFDEEMDQNPNILGNHRLHHGNGTIRDESKADTLGGVGGIPQSTALDYYQQNVVGSIIPLLKLKVDRALKILDATPNYMLCSDRVFARILCTCPWVKLIALLRNPIDRAYSQYHMQLTRDMKHPEQRRGFSTFDDYIQHDIDALYETGVLQNWNVVSFEDHFGSDTEFQAWRTYTKLGINSPVGRGLYAIQLNHLIQVLHEYHGNETDISNHLLVMSSEQFKSDTKAMYHQVLTFLRLSFFELRHYGEIHKTWYRSKAGISSKTRSLLSELFEPYNKKLAQLLHQPEWETMWSPPSSSLRET